MLSHILKLIAVFMPPPESLCFRACTVFVDELSFVALSRNHKSVGEKFALTNQCAVFLGQWAQMGTGWVAMEFYIDILVVFLVHTCHHIAIRG